MRPFGPKARTIAVVTCWEAGMVSVLMYARSGVTSREAGAFKIEVHCLRVSLSVHDLLKESGASERAGTCEFRIEVRKGDLYLASS